MSHAEKQIHLQGTLSHYAPLRVSYKLNDIFYFLAHWHLLPYGSYGLFGSEVALVDEAVGMVYVVYHLTAEASASQTHNVESGVCHRLATCHDERWYILAGACAALHHHVAAYAAELMHEHHSRDDGIVINDDLTSQLRGVAHDDAIAYRTVVSYMSILHDKVVAAHDGLA